MKKLLLTVTLFILIPGVNAVSVNLSIDSPQTNGFYTSPFDATAEANNSNANVSIFFNNSELGNGTGAVTASIPTSNTEGKFTIEATAEFSESQDSEVNDSIKIDTKDPRLPEGLSPSDIFNDTKVGHNKSFEISLRINDTFLDYVRAGEDSIESINVNLSDSGSSWEVTTTPNDLGCDANSNCSIQIEAFDEADNNDWFSKTLEVAETTDGTDNGTDSFKINISSPANGSVLENSVFPFDVTIDTGGKGLSACNYFLYDENNLVNQSGNLADDDFNKSGQVHTLIGKRLTGVHDGEYRLSLVCQRGDEEEDYEVSSNFVVVDSTPPNLKMSFDHVTNTSANVTINSTEAFRIDSLEYKVLGGANATSISHGDGFVNTFNFKLSNLSPATEYVVQVIGTDWADRKDQTDFRSTGNFMTEGGEENESQEKSLEKIVAQGRNFTNKVLKGLNYSHGISSISSEEPAEVNIGNFDMNIRKLIINVREDIRNVKLDIRSSNTSPSWLNGSRPSNSSVFEYYQIDEENAPSHLIRWVKIRFEVSQVWLQDNDINTESIALYRYEGKDGWRQLPTSLEDEGALLHTYQSLSNGFSIFAVAAEKEEKESVDEAVRDIEIAEAEGSSNESTEVNTTEQVQTEESSEESGLPWYWWIIGIFIILVLGILTYYVSISVSPSGEELEDHKVVKAHMQRLEEFVDEALKKGYSKKDLRERLVESGWDKKLVDFVLRRK